MYDSLWKRNPISRDSLLAVYMIARYHIQAVDSRGAHWHLFMVWYAFVFTKLMLSA